MKMIIFSLIIGIVLSSGIVYAASLYKAKDISYNKENWEVTNVNDALDDLYEIQKNFANELVKAEGNAIPEGVKKAYVFVEQMTTYNYQSVSITGSIINSINGVLSKSISIADTGAAVIRIYELELTGETGIVKVSFSGGSGSVA